LEEAVSTTTTTDVVRDSKTAAPFFYGRDIVVVVVFKLKSNIFLQKEANVSVTFLGLHHIRQKKTMYCLQYFDHFCFV
jgi:hypothetical protein